MSLFKELKRRNVIRAAIAYLAVAWLLIQIVETVFPAFGFDDRAVRIVVTLFAIGFLPTLIFTWIFEITSEGLKREKDVDRTRSIAAESDHKLDRVIMVVLALALAYFAFDKFLLSPHRQAEELLEAREEGRSQAFVESFRDKSIAVLPFVNLSSDPEQEYFSDGIAEELVHLLAQVPELRVISRSSSFSFKGQGIDIPSIAKKLNVAHVLEGSVRKSGNQVRITVQLIEALSDTHVWSESYDRPLVDIFSIQNEVSAEVVERLRITLLAEAPTSTETDQEAYKLVLQARFYRGRGSPGDSEKALDYYLRALDIDPGYAPGWADVSDLYGWMALGMLIPPETALPKAREAAETAVSLDPGLSIAHVRMGQAFEREGKTESARSEYEEALSLEPSNPVAYGALATLTFKIGRLEEAIELYEKAEAVDPLGSKWPADRGRLLMRAGRLDEAEKATQRALVLHPDHSFYRYNLALIQFLHGQYEVALESFQSFEESSWKYFALAISYHALDMPEASDAALDRLAGFPDLGTPHLLAEAHAYRGESAEAFNWLNRSFAWYGEVKFSPFLKNLHHDPRWNVRLKTLEMPGSPDDDLPVELAGTAFEQAEAMFKQDPAWLGTDGANSTPLDNERIFWSFEDTFIATSDAHVRSQSTIVRNSIAIQTGHDPLTAKMTFHWGRNEDGSPASFFPEDGELWYWTGGALRLDEGPLVSFLYRIAATPGQGLGFANAGHAVAIIANPDDLPSEWETKIVIGARSAFDAVPATAVLRQGEHVVGLALKQEGMHAGALVRYHSRALAAGDISGPEWWAGEKVGWVAEADLGPAGPEFVIDHAGSESSIHWDDRIQAFVHIATYGFGRAWIGMRTAPVLTGPWSDPVPVYLPPELDRPEPFIYSAIAHPEVVAPNLEELIVTYATNAFEFGDLFTEDGSKNLYWPRVIALRVGDVDN